MYLSLGYVDLILGLAASDADLPGSDNINTTNDNNNNNSIITNVIFNTNTDDHIIIIHIYIYIYTYTYICIYRERERDARRKGTDGVDTNVVTPIFMFFDRRDFCGTPVENMQLCFWCRFKQGLFDLFRKRSVFVPADRPGGGVRDARPAFEPNNNMHTYMYIYMCIYIYIY